MKKLLTVVSIAVFAAACSSNSTNTRSDNSNSLTGVDSKNAKYQILDQEFDNLLASGTDYDSLSESELQACGAAYLPPQPELKKVTPKTEVVVVKEKDLKTDTSRKKKVTNTVNIYEMDGPAPTGTPKKVSSTTTTTITSSSSSSSSSSSDGTTTYNSTGSSSTTTF